jgi:glutamate transport system permease protein
MTLIAAAISIALSLVIGTATGVIRMLLGQWGRFPLVGVMEVLRGLPVVVAIYISYRTLPQLGVNVGVLPGPDGLWFLVIALTAYNSVIIAEILRAGVAALPSGQGEAAMAMGLSRIQTMWLILLPQAFRIMLPALISQLVVVLKDTSLAGFIGVYPELLYETKSIAADLQGFIAMYAVTGAIYITINMLLSYLAVVVQRRLARGNKAPQGADGDPEGPVQPPLADAVSGRGV